MKNYNMMLIREAAKISALSSKKFNKYEYLTGEEILPSNQKQMIEQAKFTYSPLGKAFEKQIKTIEDQGEKQIEALKILKDNKEKQINNADDYKKKLLISKEREIFKNIYNEKLDKIEVLTKKNDKDDLKFIVNSTGHEIDFPRAKDLITFINEIKGGEITIAKAKKLQEDFNNYLNKIRRGIKTEEQEKTLANINMLFNGRNDAIKFIEGYSSMILEAKKIAAEEPTTGTGLKILTPKQLLQRLPIALAQVKADNNSESLLNEIRPIVYSLYQSKEISKSIQ